MLSENCSLLRTFPIERKTFGSTYAYYHRIDAEK